jgi:hypothetical protein
MKHVGHPALAISRALNASSAPNRINGCSAASASRKLGLIAVPRPLSGTCSLNVHKVNKAILANSRTMRGLAPAVVRRTLPRARENVTS